MCNIGTVATCSLQFDLVYPVFVPKDAGLVLCGAAHGTESTHKLDAVPFLAGLPQVHRRQPSGR